MTFDFKTLTIVRMPTADGTRGAVPAASSTLGFLASMGVVYTADNSFAGVGGIWNSPRSTESKDEKSLKRLHVSPENECFPPRMHVRRAGLSNPPTYSAVGTSNF